MPICAMVGICFSLIDNKRHLVYTLVHAKFIYILEVSVSHIFL